MLRNVHKYKVVLGSQSPRRRALLAGLGLEFEVRTLPDIDESFPPSMPADQIPRYIALQKASAYLPTLAENELLITADTIVHLQRTLLGKPAGKDDAIRMLRLLSGRTHQVVTGVCMCTREKTVSFAVTSSVRFAPLEEEDIQYYVDHFHPYDKAGAYGIQEWIGYVAVEGIEGSFYNVMGLPIQKVYQELTRF
ncbi:MAG: Maf-like protein [Tannerellaceae bacterium]|jgi:septum formation protein|nr:Maf-like protein [Tannerellaceae bacterium]